MDSKEKKNDMTFFTKAKVIYVARIYASDAV